LRGIASRLANEDHRWGDIGISVRSNLGAT
jgi:hypothetical protein